jgi:hypothetical protein
MTGWVGLIAVALAYLSVCAGLARERFCAARAVIDGPCSCGCDVYDQTVDYLPPEFVRDLSDDEAETCRVYMEAEAIWAETVLGEEST